MITEKTQQLYDEFWEKNGRIPSLIETGLMLVKGGNITFILQLIMFFVGLPIIYILEIGK